MFSSSSTEKKIIKSLENLKEGLKNVSNEEQGEIWKASLMTKIEDVFYKDSYFYKMSNDLSFTKSIEEEIDRLNYYSNESASLFDYTEFDDSMKNTFISVIDEIIQHIQDYGIKSFNNDTENNNLESYNSNNWFSHWRKSQIAGGIVGLIGVTVVVCTFGFDFSAKSIMLKSDVTISKNQIKIEKLEREVLKFKGKSDSLHKKCKSLEEKLKITQPK